MISRMISILLQTDVGQKRSRVETTIRFIMRNLATGLKYVMAAFVTGVLTRTIVSLFIGWDLAGIVLMAYFDFFNLIQAPLGFIMHTLYVGTSVSIVSGIVVIITFFALYSIEWLSAYIRVKIARILMRRQLRRPHP